MQRPRVVEISSKSLENVYLEYEVTPIEPLTRNLPLRLSLAAVIPFFESYTRSVLIASLPLTLQSTQYTEKPSDSVVPPLALDKTNNRVCQPQCCDRAVLRTLESKSKLDDPCPSPCVAMAVICAADAMADAAIISPIVETPEVKAATAETQLGRGSGVKALLNTRRMALEVVGAISL